MAKRKRQRGNRRNAVQEKDRLSNLPDCILLHILKFMDINYAIQTCVLSKRWKDLWKRLNNLTLRGFTNIHRYNKILSQVLSDRDDSHSLFNVDFILFRSTARKQLKNVLEYAALHNVQRLIITMDMKFRNLPNSLVPLIFSCQSLTFLELSIDYCSFNLNLPMSLMLPSLKTLHLKKVSFTSSGNACAEPFSTCNSLNSLALLDCTLCDDAQVLHISNSNLSSLKLDNITINHPSPLKVVLSVPNLTSIKILDNNRHTYYELSSTCNLMFIKEVSIFPRNCANPLIAISWLKVFSNLKTLTLSSCTLIVIQNELSNLATKEIEPPCFERLELLKIKLCPHFLISDDEVTKIVDYLLLNSPQRTVAGVRRLKVIKHRDCCSLTRCFTED